MFGQNLELFAFSTNICELDPDMNYDNEAISNLSTSSITLKIGYQIRIQLISDLDHEDWFNVTF